MLGLRLGGARGELTVPASTFLHGLEAPSRAPPDLWSLAPRPGSGSRPFVYAVRSPGTADGSGVVFSQREKSVSPVNNSTMPMNSA